jgi:nucleotide-binding universal stress UspA family protein
MEPSSIVCGVTGSAHAQKAALEAAVLAKKHNAKLTYVYAVDASFLRGGMAVEISPSFGEETLEHLGGHIVDTAEEIARSQGVTPKKVVRRGKVLDVLKQVVAEEKADLLVLGHEERTFFDKLLLKGNVEDNIGELKQKTGADVTIVR